MRKVKKIKKNNKNYKFSNPNLKRKKKSIKTVNKN